jgi:hypothetical protein
VSCRLCLALSGKRDKAQDSHQQVIFLSQWSNDEKDTNNRQVGILSNMLDTYLSGKARGWMDLSVMREDYRMSEAKTEYKIHGRPQTIYRVVKNKDNPYVMIDRRPVDNPKLSYKAKGILTYLLSRPDGWEVSVADLIKHGAEGEAAIRSGLKELKQVGHMKYTQARDQGRITGWLIEVFEVPISPDRDFQDVENQDVENQGQLINRGSNKQKKLVIKAGGKPPTPEKPKAETPPEIKLYHEVVGKYPKKAVYEEVVKAIQSISARLLRPCVAGDLSPYFKAWMTKSNNEYNFSVWLLLWAVQGKITNGFNSQQPQEPKGFQAGRNWLERKMSNG